MHAMGSPSRSTCWTCMTRVTFEVERLHWVKTNRTDLPEFLPGARLLTAWYFSPLLFHLLSTLPHILDQLRRWLKLCAMQWPFWTGRSLSCRSLFQFSTSLSQSGERRSFLGWHSFVVCLTRNNIYCCGLFLSRNKCKRTIFFIFCYHLNFVFMLPCSCVCSWNLKHKIHRWMKDFFPHNRVGDSLRPL